MRKSRIVCPAQFCQYVSIGTCQLCLGRGYVSPALNAAFWLVKDDVERALQEYDVWAMAERLEKLRKEVIGE